MKYSTVLIDPPWRYKTEGWRGGAKNHYPTLPPAAFFEMPIPDLLENDAHVWLWTTDTFYDAALDIIDYWGLKLRNKRQKKSQLIKKATWDWIKLKKNPMDVETFEEYLLTGKPYVMYDGKPYKLQWGNGFYKRGAKENLILAVRGKNICDEDARQIEDVIFAPVNKHSTKPKEAYDLVRSYSPENRLDIFARHDVDGFESWGNQAPNNIIIPALDDWSEWALKKWPPEKTIKEKIANKILNITA